MIKSFGRHSYDSNSITLHTYGDTEHYLEVGHFTSIAGNINIFLTDGRGHELQNGTTYPFGSAHTHIFNNVITFPYKTKGNVIIGNDVWIGHSSIIMNGITIGDGAVVATNSHVIKDVPPYAVVGGNPAKVLKYRFEKEIIDKFLELKWWDLSDEEINKILPELQQPPTLETFDKIDKLLKG